MENNVSRERVNEFYFELSKLVFPDSVEDTFDDVHSALDNINYTIEHLMYEVMQPCGILIEHCTWLGRTKPCDVLFRVATSEEGFCCSFNYKAPLDALEV